MPRYDESKAECYIITSTEGMLASLAHDLRIRIDRFEITVDPEKMLVEAKFDPASLHVECVIRDGEERFDILSDEDRGVIDGHISKDILDAEFYDQITFQSTSIVHSGKDYKVKGMLSLTGTVKEIEFLVRDLGDHKTAKIKLHQPDFGIKPFSTMAGTIRVKPDLNLHVSVPFHID